MFRRRRFSLLREIPATCDLSIAFPATPDRHELRWLLLSLLVKAVFRKLFKPEDSHREQKRERKHDLSTPRQRANCSGVFRVYPHGREIEKKRRKYISEIRKQWYCSTLERNRPFANTCSGGDVDGSDET